MISKMFMKRLGSIASDVATIAKPNQLEEQKA